MNFKARGLVTVIPTVAIAGQAMFVQETGARAGDTTAQSSDAERIARLEALLENLRQELKIPAYSAAIVKDQKVRAPRRVADTIDPQVVMVRGWRSGRMNVL